MEKWDAVNVCWKNVKLQKQSKQIHLRQEKYALITHSIPQGKMPMTSPNQINVEKYTYAPSLQVYNLKLWTGEFQVIAAFQKAW